MTDTNEFQIKSYTWKELALLYSPLSTPGSASRRLRQWVNHNPLLCEELQETGWQKGSRLLLPIQVKILVHYLGEP